MRNFTKCIGSLIAVLGGLTFVGGALAAYNPTFGVASSLKGTTITYHQGAGDDPAAQISLYVPVNYALDVGDVGFPVGTVTAKASAADLGGAVVPLSGSIDPHLSTDTISFGGSSNSLASLATACTGKSTHDAFWLLNLSAAGQTLQVPLYVDRVDPTTPLGQFLWFKLTVCLPPPDVPAGTPGRAALGAKLLDFSLTINSVVAEVDGNHRWFLTATPYTPGAGKANAAGTIEIQALDPTPTILSIAAKHGSKAGTVTVKGRLFAGRTSFAGQKVTIYNGKKVVGTATTKSGGAYSLTIRLRSAATLSAASSVGVHAVGGACTSLFGAPTCLGTDIGGFSIKSTAIRFKP
jgi:hypothetical protein